MILSKYPAGAPGKKQPAPYYIEVKSVTISWDDDGERGCAGRDGVSGLENGARAEASERAI